MKNALGVEFPQYIDGIGELKGFDGKRFGSTAFEEELKAPHGRNK